MTEGAGRPGFPRHFDGKRFYNPGAPQARGGLDLFRWKWTSRPQPSPRFVDDIEQTVPPVRVETGNARVTLVNHSTVLLQHRGRNILTDPIWSERASPVSWAGPRRKRNPGVAFENLPPIDVVLISHNHYDHLDLATLHRLAARGGSAFVVPKGVARLFRAENIGPVQELDWGESGESAGVNVHAVPAFHFSARGLFDRNRTLWCGYMIECGGQLLYFAGDTAFGPHFAWIREKFGSPRLALLPIGAYEPRWFMSPVHMPPEDAVKAHQILASKWSVAIHHGTFQLADESPDAPRERLRELAPGDSFVVLDNGQSVTLE
jgi:L-ascorbate metabolism protein UlaG (beta-lactamase superfamily)